MPNLSEGQLGIFRTNGREKEIEEKNYEKRFQNEEHSTL
jgi:hypothetical protein